MGQTRFKNEPYESGRRKGFEATYNLMYTSVTQLKEVSQRVAVCPPRVR
jgi:hypothetical protein